MERTRLAGRALTGAAAALAALAIGATAAGADDWGQRTAGRHVYDTTAVLSAAQVADLERAAGAVDLAGAPTVVYLRLKDADVETTRQDARALMEAWAVESAPGARDGFVLLVNLRPGGGVHGSAAMAAGARHADDGRLSGGRLQAVYDAMRPRLADGDLAGGLSVALADVAGDLGEAPAPASPPPGTQPVSPAAVAGGVIGAGLGVAVLLGVLITAVRGGWRGGGPGGPGGGPGGPGKRSWSGMDSSSSAATSSFSGGDGGASSGSSSAGGSF